MVGRNNGSRLRLLAVLGAILLLSSVVAVSGLQSGVVAAADHGGSGLDFADTESGNFIINYIYEIEIENKDSPQLELDDDTVPQGGSFMANGTNFDANSTADMSIFHEQLLSLSEDGEAAERSAAVLLTASNLTISEDGDDLVIENAGNETSTADGDGSVMLATNIFPTDASSDEYEVSLECETGPDGNNTSASFGDSLSVDNSTSRQFLEMSLPAGDYEQCQVVMSPSDEDGPAIESSTADLTVVAGFDAETTIASVNGTTDGDGSFMQNVTVALDAEEGRYVLMAETTNDTDDGIKRAIAPLTIASGDETSTAGTADGISTGSDGGSESEGGTAGDSNTSGPQDSTGSGGNGTHTPPDDTDTQGPPAPPGDGGQGGSGGEGGGGDDGGYVDPCQDVVSDSGNVNNTIAQSSSQSASNTASDDDVINVVQRIHGTYNGTGHLNTSIAIDDSDTVSQSINQDVAQNAVIKKCPGEPGEGGNQTNTIDMNATQLASNAYSDNTTIIIVQTIIIPKDCNTNVNAPISISDRDTVTQSIDQDIDQDGVIAYGGSGEGSNTVVQTSMQVAHNNATNDEVITINQVIIVPPDCPVEIQAPIVVEGDDNVQMSAVQTAEQDAAINSSAGGVTIVSSVEGSGQTTNTVVTTASQGGQNSFSDDDTITITQNVYYVNDTSGWTEENYEENLAQEFGNSTSGNSTSPIIANLTGTEDGNATSPAVSNSTTTDTGGNSTSTEDPDVMMMAAMSADEENIVIEENNNSTSTEDTGGEGGNSTDSETFEASSAPEPVVEETEIDETPPSPGNSTDMASEESMVEEPPVEESTEEDSSEQPPEPETAEQETTEQQTTSEPVENTEDTTTEETTIEDQPPVDEQPPVEESTEPPVEEIASDPLVEEDPPADTNATDNSAPPEDPASVENQESTSSGNSTSIA